MRWVNFCHNLRLTTGQSSPNQAPSGPQAQANPSSRLKHYSSQQSSLSKTCTNCMLRKVFLLQGLDHLGSVFVPPGVMMTSLISHGAELGDRSSHWDSSWWYLGCHRHGCNLDDKLSRGGFFWPCNEVIVSTEYIYQCQFHQTFQCHW